MSSVRWSLAVTVCCGVAACGELGARRDNRGAARDTVGPPDTVNPQPPEAAPQPDRTRATLTVIVKDLRNSRGDLIFGVFKSSDGFPTVEKKSVNWQTRAIDGRTVTFTADLPPGRYAASVLHDENKSGQMDRNLANIPVEGYGVTNNPRPAFRAATFEEAAFDLPEQGRSMTISVQYF